MLLRDVREQLTLELCGRLLGVGVRDVGLGWPGPGGDSREMPLEAAANRQVAKNLQGRSIDPSDGVRVADLIVNASPGFEYDYE